MTLWSIAKSPLIYGGDLRQLDQSTYNLITHPILLEINSFSTHNMEFPYITGEKDNRSGNRALSVPSRNSDKLRKSNAYVGLSSCKDHGSTRWVIEALDQEHERICWKDNLGSKYEPLFCLHRRKSLLISDEETIHKQQYDGKLHLLSTDDKELCLDASPRKKLTSGEMKINSFFPCRLKANQMWKFNLNGTLTSSYSGQCAVLKVKKAKAKVESGGIRCWIATGRRGEIYVSFFNLSAEKTVISAKISDLTKAFPSRNLRRASCKYREVWSAKYYGAGNQTISIPVEMHSCALFVLNCI